MSVAANALHLVGKTPLVCLKPLSPKGGATIWGKLEALNPGGSVKDRICLAMIEHAEASGALKPGMGVVEATSGNTGIGLAMTCAVKGYPLTLAMPDTMSVERRGYLKAFGAEIVLTPAEDGAMSQAITAAEEIAASDGWFMPKQFENPANPRMHEITTGPEIWEQTGGRLDAFVAGVGTGGTITGVGRFMRKKRAAIKMVAVQPSASPVLTGGSPGEHAIQGIGAGFVPPVLDRSVVDSVVSVTDADAFAMTHRLVSEVGVLVGVSSGANVDAARKLAEGMGVDDHVVTVLCDTGHRYLTVDGFIRRPEENECL
ncbi:MAG: cysteine synthase A [Candidatus Latescibacteria bacterium]|jgi:cysteine synthase A|nr:cysteine synthase A [Candidatus Latescibacterota bacterium]